MYARQLQQLHEQNAWLYVCPALTQSMFLFGLLFQQRGTLCHVRFYVSFSPPLFPGSFAGHFHNMMVPYQGPPKLHFENTIVPYQLPLWFMLRTWLWGCREIHIHFQIFTTRLLLFNNTNVFTVRHMNTNIQTVLVFGSPQLIFMQHVTNVDNSI